MDQGNNNQQNIQQSTQQTQSSPTIVAPTQGTTTTPVSGSLKEHAPIGQQLHQEMIQPTEQEPILAPEVKEAGVTTVQNLEHIQVKPELQAVGVEPVKTAVPMPSEPLGTIKLPMTVDEAKKVAKTHPAVDSIKWLATLVIEQARKIHQVMQ